MNKELIKNLNNLVGKVVARVDISRDEAVFDFTDGTSVIIDINWISYEEAEAELDIEFCKGKEDNDIYYHPTEEEWAEGSKAIANEIDKEIIKIFKRDLKKFY